jgi:hypothetical protein
VVSIAFLAKDKKTLPPNQTRPARVGTLAVLGAASSPAVLRRVRTRHQRNATPSLTVGLCDSHTSCAIRRPWLSVLPSSSRLVHLTLRARDRDTPQSGEHRAPNQPSTPSLLGFLVLPLRHGATECTPCRRTTACKIRLSLSRSRHPSDRLHLWFSNRPRPLLHHILPYPVTSTHKDSS